MCLCLSVFVSVCVCVSVFLFVSVGRSECVSVFSVLVCVYMLSVFVFIRGFVSETTVFVWVVRVCVYV